MTPGSRAAVGLDGVSQHHDDLQRFERGVAVVGFFAFGQLGVGDEAGMFFPRVVPLGTQGPAVGEALPGPNIVVVLRQSFDERRNFGRQFAAARFQRLRIVGH